jgi:hypothetical protein
MKKDDVVQFFGNQTKAAERLGVTKSAVSQWGELVPEKIAYRAQYESGGVLKFDATVYRKKENGGGTGEQAAMG